MAFLVTSLFSSRMSWSLPLSPQFWNDFLAGGDQKYTGGTHKNCALASFLNTCTVEVGPPTVICRNGPRGVIPNSPKLETNQVLINRRKGPWMVVCSHMEFCSALRMSHLQLHTQCERVSQTTVKQRKQTQRSIYPVIPLIPSSKRGKWDLQCWRGWKGAQGIILFLIWVLFSWAY